MKSTIKCIAVLASIAVACTALLSACNFLLPKKDMTYALMSSALKDSSATEFEIIDIKQYEDKGVLAGYKALNGEEKNGIVLKVSGKALSYGTFSLLVGFSRSTDKIVGIEYLESFGSSFYGEPLKDEGLFKQFYNQDVSKMSHSSLNESEITRSTAKNTINGAFDSIKTAYEVYGLLNGKKEKTEVQKKAEELFGIECPEDPILENTQTYSGVTIKTYATSDSKKFYNVGGLHYENPEDSDDHYGGTIYIYATVVDGKYVVIFDKVENIIGESFPPEIAWVNNQNVGLLSLAIAEGSGSTYSTSSVIELINSLYTNVLEVA